MRNLLIGLLIGLSLVAGMASAQDDEEGDGDQSNLAIVELGNAVFSLDAQGAEVGCAVEVLD
jgi:hypothetical protein